MPTDLRPRLHREVTSFVRRSARMRDSQRRAYEAQVGGIVLDVPQGALRTSVADDAAVLDLPATFGRTAPVVVEIGCGPGDSLVPMARARPEIDVLAFEVFEPAAAALVARAVREDVSNVRVAPVDAVAGLERLVPAGGLAEVWTFFPDPWPKLKHHKRRLIDPAFADLVASRLRPGGLWRLATDWAEYADQMRAVVGGHPAFVAEPEERGDRPVTRFERRGLAEDRAIADLVYRRVA
ncbi:tRNA (guanosine(46)-N7)-methyltransferase TrmB [Microlunatus antarcticus]|uniref:tRNA (guanine-N(7)-)-methyltransferase n=1 Tax=Microlunatus antarcticus TaxID=53388 RepID=A0A7W5JSI8_9ACTN|nr:tRNA (guanine-N7-)-methyltransferase [Microlunatus antarcticus]